MLVARIPAVTQGQSGCATKMKLQRGPLLPSAEKEPVMGMDEMPQTKFVIRRKLNPYVNPRANLRGNDLFWTK